MHVPQSEQSRIELAELACVQSQIVSPAQHKPIISIVQDTLVGSYLFTRYDNYLTRQECLDILVDIKSFKGVLPPPEIPANASDAQLPAGFPKYKYPDRSIPLWSGRQIFSMIIPPVNLKTKNDSAKYDIAENPHNFVHIENGIVKSGVFDKSILGQSNSSLIYIIFNEFGPERTQQFLDDIQNIITNWIIKSGFSVGIGDLIPDMESSAKMREIINTKKREVIEIIEHVHKGILEHKSGKTTAEEFEMQILKALNVTTNETGKIALKHLNSNNRMLNMVLSGSKGSEINIGQMIACVGQQAIDGRRIPYGFTDRTLPHFHKYDDGASARGFVESSFMRGLNPTEFFFHAMGGREGLIDTAVKSVTGDTPVIYMENGETKYANIGDWIDSLLARYPNEVNHFEERQMEHLYLKDNVVIPTTDENGRVTWEQVTAVTRHDPGVELYEIKTEGGRRVIVTESKSLLIWNEDTKKLVETSTPDIKVGDSVPVTMNLPYAESGVYDESNPDTIIHATPDIIRQYIDSRMNAEGRITVDTQKEADIVGMCYTRLGLYTTMKVEDNRFTVEVCDNPVTQNDVVLDRIVEINVIGIEKYPKVYDLTIPTTLNFGLANGLQVRDTSDTGYIQRKLIKGMEDARIMTDYTVRNANGTILQFLYGEDGFDGAKIEKQKLTSLGKSDKELYDMHHLNMDDDYLRTVYLDEIVRDILSHKELLEEQYKKHLNKIISDRDYYFEHIFKGKMDQELYAPINIQRLVDSASQRFSNKTGLSDLHPQYVFNRLDELEKSLTITEKFKGNELIMVLAHLRLSPTLLNKTRINKLAFDYIIASIQEQFHRAIAHPGELVGTIAAQSMGEPSTQMSIVGSSHIVINSANNYYSGDIKTFCDKLFEKYSEQSLHYDNDSSILDLPEDFYIIGVSQDEKTSWRRISQISRHPANGGLVEVVTRTGRRVTGTLSHSFLTRSEEGVVPILGSDLTIGLRIPIAKTIPELPNPIYTTTVETDRDTLTFDLDRKFGWICGMYLADGSIKPNSNIISISKVDSKVEELCREFCDKYECKFSNKQWEGEYGQTKDNNIHSKAVMVFIRNHFGTGTMEKSVSPFIYNTNKEFIQGIVAGFFDGDGNIDASKQMIRCGSRNKELLHHIARLLGFCSIFATFCEEKSCNYPGKVFYTLQIPKNLAVNFKECVELCIPHKVSALQSIVNYVSNPDRRNCTEYIDTIPVVGNIISTIARLLKLSDRSEKYSKWSRKESIGRMTFNRYYEEFKGIINGNSIDSNIRSEVDSYMKMMKMAVDSNVLWDEIVELKYIDDPQEYVYDFTVPGNDSFMIDDNVLVHNTLNSVDWNTKIVIMCDGKIVTPQIGEWIDEYYTKCNQSKVQHLENNQIYIELDDGHDWKACSCDEQGNMVWTKLEAITRHPVINHDGTDTILEVELESGRTVRATKGKSFLTLIDGKIQPYDGYDLKVGDILPIANSLALEQVGLTIDDVQTADLQLIAQHKQYIYTENGIQEVDSIGNEMNDIVWDKVKSITETRPIHGWMYDVTVEGTHNFLTANGINMFDEMRRKQEALKGCNLLVGNQI